MKIFKIIIVSIKLLNTNNIMGIPAPSNPQSYPAAVGLRLQVRSRKLCDCMVEKGAHKFALFLPASHQLSPLRAFPASP